MAFKDQAFRLRRTDWKTLDELGQEVSSMLRADDNLRSHSPRMIRVFWGQDNEGFTQEAYSIMLNDPELAGKAARLRDSLRTRDGPNGIALEWYNILQSV